MPLLWNGCFANGYCHGMRVPSISLNTSPDFNLLSTLTSESSKTSVSFENLHQTPYSAMDTEIPSQHIS